MKRNKPNSATLFIDADIPIYKAAAFHQKNVDFDGDGDEVCVVNPEAAQRMISDYVEEVKDLSRANKVVMCLSDSENFRKQLWSPYKANRKDVVRPLLLKELIEWTEKNFAFLRFPRLEADDVVGIMGTQENPSSTPIMVSEDKDLKGVPGTLLNPRKAEFPHVIHPDEANIFHMTQCLVGDSADGYTGCPGIGAVRAERILSGKRDPQTLWKLVVAAYEDKGLTEDDALLTARLSKILTADMYNQKTHKVRLWKQPAQ